MRRTGAKGSLVCGLAKGMVLAYGDRGVGPGDHRVAQGPAPQGFAGAPQGGPAPRGRSNVQRRHARAARRPRGAPARHDAGDRRDGGGGAGDEHLAEPRAPGRCRPFRQRVLARRPCVAVAVGLDAGRGSADADAHGVGRSRSRSLHPADDPGRRRLRRRPVLLAPVGDEDHDRQRDLLRHLFADLGRAVRLAAVGRPGQSPGADRPGPVSRGRCRAGCADLRVQPRPRDRRRARHRDRCVLRPLLPRRGSRPAPHRRGARNLRAQRGWRRCCCSPPPW